MAALLRTRSIFIFVIAVTAVVLGAQGCGKKRGKSPTGSHAGPVETAFQAAAAFQPAPGRSGAVSPGSATEMTAPSDFEYLDQHRGVWQAKRVLRRLYNEQFYQRLRSNTLCRSSVVNTRRKWNTWPTK